jgi:hypothetical protein
MGIGLAGLGIFFATVFLVKSYSEDRRKREIDERMQDGGVQG